MLLINYHDELSKHKGTNAAWIQRKGDLAQLLPAPWGADEIPAISPTSVTLGIMAWLVLRRHQCNADNLVTAEKSEGINRRCSRQERC